MRSSIFREIKLCSHVKGVPCHHGMGRTQVADEAGDLQIWRVAVNILNKQLRTGDKGWSSSLWVGRGANNSSPQKISFLRNVTKGLGPGRIIWINGIR
jgi:hypothetical protein